jgi:hypothetical protein
MRQGPLDIMLPQTLVKGNGLSEISDCLRWSTLKSSTAGYRICTFHCPSFKPISPSWSRKKPFGSARNTRHGIQDWANPVHLIFYPTLLEQVIALMST